MNACSIVDLGLIAYAEAWELQERVVAARKAGAIEDVLLFCEHPHVITLGRSGNRANLLASESVLRQKGVEFFETSRGGDITYHGPGQIVGYPILNLGAIRRDVVWYVRALEEAMIRATADLGIAARREPGKTGIWVDADEVADRSKRDSSPALGMTDQQAEKLAAIGVHISRWVTSHGFAYNVATDLRYFELIVPCGIAGRKATSLEKLLGRRVSLEEIRPLLVKQVCEVFALTARTEEPAGLFAKLAAFEQALSVSA
jgi:lipoyl(octanoyl) transferase